MNFGIKVSDTRDGGCEMVYGPFDSVEEAARIAEKRLNVGVWCLIPLYSLTYELRKLEKE